MVRVRFDLNGYSSMPAGMRVDVFAEGVLPMLHTRSCRVESEVICGIQRENMDILVWIDLVLIES